MGMRQLEAAILAELKEIAKDKRLRQKDIMEWRTGRDLVVREGETYYYLPRLGISVAVRNKGT